MEEEWKDIKGYEGLYQVSNLGRIKSLSRRVKCGNGYITTKEKILKQANSHKGYKVIRLEKNYIKKSFVVHRLVAKNFIENPFNKSQVNHIDGDKTNNKIDNLEWNTQSENIRHAYDTGLNNWRLKLDENKIIELYTNNIRYVKIAKMFNVSSATIRRVLKRNGIHIRSYGEYNIKFKLSKGELRELLKIKTQKEIAKDLNLNERTICQYKKLYNL